MSDKPTPTGGMDQFFTRDAANQGIELPLFYPGGGESGHWIRIRGVDSDEFRATEAAEERGLLSATVTEKRARTDAELEASTIRLLASLVISWSFPEACTRENVIRFLTNAPQIRDQINKIAAQRSRFLAAPSAISSDSPSSTSD